MSSSLTLSLVLAALLLVFAIARIVYPGKDQQGSGFTGISTFKHPSDTLVVGTFNVQTGKNLVGERDINQAAALIAQADIVAVQEVYGAGWLNKLGFGKEQTIALAEPGGFGHLFAATRYRWWREQRGNALLSKLPVTKWQVKMLPDQSRKSPRNMMIATVPWQGSEVTVINTHLHTGRGRLEQLKTVLAELDRHSVAILMGDFNTTINEDILATALASSEMTDAIEATGIEQQGHSRIDWVLTKGLRVLAGSSAPKGVSDHPYYQLEVALDK